MTLATELLPLGESMNYETATLDAVIRKKMAAQPLEAPAAVISDVHLTMRSTVGWLIDAETTPSLGKINGFLKQSRKALDKAQEHLTELSGGIPLEGEVFDLQKEIKRDTLVTKASGTLAEVMELWAQTGTLLSELETLVAGLMDEEALKATPDVVAGVTQTRKISQKALHLLKKVGQYTHDLSRPDFDEQEAVADYFLSCIATLLFNDILPETVEEGANVLHMVKSQIRSLQSKIDDKVEQDLNSIIHTPAYKALESSWIGLQDLLQGTDWNAGIMIDILDVSKEELAEDFDSNEVDLTSSDLFKKVYVAEYDQYGGIPYSGIIGVYEFENTLKDRRWLKTMGNISAASHAPFVSSVGPQFFGCETIQELADIKDLKGHMSQPRFDAWNTFRDSEEAAYIGVAVPRYLLRAPWDPENNPAGELAFKESINPYNGHEDFLWGNASYLFAKNMVRSFAETGWCQYLRGPKGGGLQQGLPRYFFDFDGIKEMKIPVEFTIPDYRELAFAETGFIPLVYRKGTADACFFSCQSLKKSKKFKDPQDTENSQLVTNLSYTFSITRIAHYIKCIMRDNIGLPADAAYINNVILSWLSKYVTTVVNPDDRTLRYYPFKAVSVETTEQEGMVGWYKCVVSVLPHLQFEGMDVELRLDVRL
ncbi:type VI secretion system contractile sheath large subunit [Desulfoluna spongiiphila]|uniref:Type VI secretion system protein ImpC n=1 Tax=Desulfoluna spongiiphila TaxID=419481 RepID=A0A1G5FIT6_9BACT|nr:type VI secretion system contractile sheath large subunit [Desulfoluna spongiiphila]SCY39061.1 type VI secretion system protein ImpC [Desulfoluna spongiiphila]